MSEATKLIDLIDPEVMADMISAKVDKKMVVTLIAKIDNTLVGTPGSTITVPSCLNCKCGLKTMLRVNSSSLKLETKFLVANFAN